jgi:UDP-sulfoquinovose synthase
MKKNTILILGGDGYLGWSLGLAFANRTDSNVILADNMIKRNWEKEVETRSLIPFKSPEDRIEEYTKIFGKSNLSFEKLDLLEYLAVVRIINKHKPTIIINAAQQPSAPFSMMSAKNAAATFQNNVIGNLNVLWAISETDKNIKYIKLGSAGCYSGIDTDYVPLEKVDFKFNYKNKDHEILQSWTPMYATDLYHQSKIDDFLMNNLASEVWKLKIITVQQSTIFGATIEENHSEERSGLSTRFNYDAVFGTVINRFICQLHLGGPLTVYGEGNQTTGLISLSDTVDNFMNIADMDVSPGEHKVAHNYTFRMSINEIAEAITDIDRKIPVLRIRNPRKETEGRLHKEVETHEAIANSHKNKEAKIKKELMKLIEFVGRHKDNIDASVIMPKILWEKEQKSPQEISPKEKSSLTMPQ